MEPRERLTNWREFGKRAPQIHATQCAYTGIGVVVVASYLDAVWPTPRSELYGPAHVFFLTLITRYFNDIKQYNLHV